MLRRSRAQPFSPRALSLVEMFVYDLKTSFSATFCFNAMCAAWSALLLSLALVAEAAISVRGLPPNIQPDEPFELSWAGVGEFGADVTLAVVVDAQVDEEYNLAGKPK